MPATEGSGAEGGADRGVVTAERTVAAGVVLPVPFTVVMTPEQLTQHLRARAIALGGGEPNQKNRGRGRGRGRPPLHEDSRKQRHTEGRGWGHCVEGCGRGCAEGRGRGRTEGRGADGRGRTERREQGRVDDGRGRTEERGQGLAEGRGRGRGADERGRTEGRERTGGRGQGHTEEPPLDSCGRTSIEYKSYLLKKFLPQKFY